MMNQEIIIAAASLIGLMVVTVAALTGWQGWLTLKASEFAVRHPEMDRVSPLSAARIEIADLKERIRKLEAIASGWTCKATLLDAAPYALP